MWGGVKLLQWGVRFFSLLLVALWVTADQALKLYTVTNLEFHGPAQTVVPGLLAFTYALNKGAAWSLFWGQLGWLTALRFTVGLVILVILLRPSVKGWSRFALSLIAAGAFGNAVDGFFREGVVDMLILWPLTTVYRAVTGSPYPIFNIADIGVVGGALTMIASSFLSPKTPERPEAAPFEFVDTYTDPYAKDDIKGPARREAQTPQAMYQETGLDAFTPADRGAVEVEPFVAEVKSEPLAVKVNKETDAALETTAAETTAAETTTVETPAVPRVPDDPRA